MPQYWAGIVAGRVDSRDIDNGFGGWGETKHRAPALFTTRAEAQKHYEVVRKVEVKFVSKSFTAKAGK